MESWFKVSSDISRNKKLLIIRAEQNGDSMALLWFFLLAMAREQNDDGYIYAADGVSYTAKTLAACCALKPKVVEKALELFETYNMIEVEDNGYIYIVGWSEHQSAGELAKIKERERCKEAMKVKRQREKRNNAVTVTENDRNNAVTNADVTVQNKNKKENKNTSNNNNNNSTVTENKRNCYGEKVVVVSNIGEKLASDNNPFGFWNRNISPLSPHYAEVLQVDIDEFGEEKVMAAVVATHDAKKDSLNYYSGVLKNIIVAGNSRPIKEQMPF